MVCDKALTPKQKKEILQEIKSGRHPIVVASDYHANICDIYQLLADDELKAKKG